MSLAKVPSSSGPTCEDSPGQILLPAEASRGNVQPQRPAKPCQIPGHNRAQTDRFLKDLGLERWSDIFHAECIGVNMLSSMTFSDLKAALPSVPSGVVFRMQSKAATWQDQARSFVCLAQFCLCHRYSLDLICASVSAGIIVCHAAPKKCRGLSTLRSLLFGLLLLYLLVVTICIDLL